MALNLYNNPFNNFVQRTYQPQTPQNRLQNAYEKAMSNRTPEWARTVSDMMPSLAEIGAYFGTKGAFNQGRIADSLEREKQRRTAYNQMMRENEDKQVNDYVQMAKEQLGMDMALDDRERAKENAQIQRDMELNRIKEEQRRYEEAKEERQRQQDINNKWKEIDDINKREALEQAKIQQDIENKRNAENDLLNRAYKQAQIDTLNRENNPEYIKQQQEQAIKQEQDKQRQEQLKTYVATAKELFNKGLLSNEDLVAIEKNPELAESLVPAKKRVPLLNIPTFFDSSRRLKIDKNAKQDFQILKDANGNMAKVYKDGRIEEL